MNLEQVAKLAQVSTATVSRVVNNSAVVNPSTRDRVMKAISELNYHPNLHARTLAGGKSSTIGMIVSNLENPFFLDIFRTIESLAHAQGHEVLVANTNYTSEQLVRSIRLMIGRRVAGVVAIVSEMDEHSVNELTASNIPAVFYDASNVRPCMTNIRVDYEAGVEQAVAYLHRLGHRRIGFIGHHAGLHPLDVRKRTVLDLSRHHNPAYVVRSAAAGDGFEGGRMAARELLSSGFSPTAIFCVNDVMAIGVLRELREQGISIPGEISVIGCDNIQLAEYCHPTLTTIHIPRNIIGKMAFETIVDGGGKARGELVITPEFVIRNSTGPARTV